MRRTWRDIRPDAITDAYFGIGVKHHHVAQFLPPGSLAQDVHAIARGPATVAKTLPPILLESVEEVLGSIPHADAAIPDRCTAHVGRQSVDPLANEFVLSPTMHAVGRIGNKVYGLSVGTCPRRAPLSFWWYNGAVDSGNLAVTHHALRPDWQVYWHPRGH